MGGIGPSSLVHARTLTDATQVLVKLNDSPQRIVTLAPSLGELAAELVGADFDRIVGVSEYTDEPAGLKKVTSIGPYHQVNLEKVVSLKPDLVLATSDGNSKEQVLHLRELGVPVVVVRTESFKDIEESIQLVAEAIGSKAQGAKMVTQLKSGLQKFKERSKKHAPLKTILQMGDQPLVVAGGKSFLSESLKLLGATNLYAESDHHYPRPSLEDVLHRDPEAIVVLTFGKDLKPFRVMAQRWTQFPDLKAVKTKRVVILKSDALLRPTLRILEGISQLERVLYGKT